ncbi:HNH endonuclease [Acinetobacter soli]|uniref:HNH endonuclease n=1 Tax=Acinetobacter soli TaxID=487316 RepID=UPI0028136090|nr:HNH endonuclease [Acinetobacter soli]MDQ9833246.1 HNH endonuclease [Acinetobacter soli]
MFESLLENFNKPDLRFFIFDSKNDHLIYGDKDFDEYHWDQARYNKPRIGDFFLYRRPQKASEVKGQFYIYGLGKIKSIQSINNADDATQKKRDKHVIAHVEQGIRFKDPILQSDLEDFEWTFKKRGNTWEHFFQQYGMNEINQTDFIALLKIGLKNQLDALDISSVEEDIDYRVEDKRANVKIRGKDQRDFSLQVKLNYQYRCAISGITSKEFLIASHIIPWAVDWDNRKNPFNGICLSSLLDTAFDKGYITIDQQYRVVISNKAKEDKALFEYLKQYEGKKLEVPKQYLPKQDFLEWHRNRFINN